MKGKKIVRIFLISYAVLLLAAATVTFGWYVFNRDVDVQNGVSVTVGSYLKVSLDGKEWGNRVEYLPETETQGLVDVTGDGQTFYWPQALTDETDKAPSDAGMYTLITDETCTGYYITFTVKLQTTSALDVYLGKNSKITPKEQINGLKQYDRPSLYGDFSADGIAGAARVAVLEVGEESDTLKTVWVPNPGYQVQYDSVDGKVTFIEGSLNNYESSYGYMAEETEGVFSRHTYSFEDYVNTVSVGNERLATKAVYTDDASGTELTPALSNGAPLLCSFPENGTVQEKELRVRIWVEGTDREADKALNGGQMDYSLEFVGIPCKQNNDEAYEKLMESVTPEKNGSNNNYKLYYDTNGNKTKDEGEEYLASELLRPDGGRGYRWVNVNQTGGDLYSAGTTYYFKFRETAEFYESKVFEYTFEA